MLNFIKTPHGNRDSSELSVNNAHNPFVYITTSNKNGRKNYKYLLDVFVKSTKISTLIKNPDLSTGNSKYGIFDLSEIISTELKYNPQLIGEVSTSNLHKIDEEVSKIVNVTLREQYSTENRWTSTANVSGNTRLFIENPSDLVSTERILIGNSVFNVSSVWPTAINIIAPFGTLPTTGTFREGQSFYDNYYYEEDGIGKVAFLVFYNPRISAGDRILIKQDGTPTNPSYDGEFRVTGVEQINISGPFPGQNWIVKTNITWANNTPVEGGAYFNLSDYKPQASKSTLGVRSFANNSVQSYEKILGYNDTHYQFDGTTKRFLTNAPTTQKFRSDDPISLGFFDGLPQSQGWSHLNLNWFLNPVVYTGSVNGFGVDTYTAITISNLNTPVIQVNDTVELIVNNVKHIGKALQVGVAGLTTEITTDIEIDVQSTGTINAINRSFFSTRNLNINNPYITKMIELGLPKQQLFCSNYPTQGFSKFTLGAVNRTNTPFTNIFDISPRSEIREFVIEDKCYEWETYNLAWINPYGVWDYFEFKGRPSESNNITREFARKSLLTYDNNNFSYEIGDRGQITYNIEGDRILETSSGIINIETAKWLKEIYTSPAVYVITGDLKIPVNVLNTEIVLPDNQRGLINLPLSFSYANKIFTQGN